MFKCQIANTPPRIFVDGRLVRYLNINESSVVPFLSFSRRVKGPWPRALDEGAQVEFDVIEENGRSRASNVCAPGGGPDSPLPRDLNPRLRPLLGHRMVRRDLREWWPDRIGVVFTFRRSSLAHGR